MTLNLKDRSNYLRGIMLLNINYNGLSSKKCEMIKEIGSILGFDKNFVEESVNELFQNKNISLEPPKFSNVLFAEAFLKDCIRIILSDYVLNINELHLMWTIATINSISRQWLFWELENFLYEMEKDQQSSYEVKKIMEIQN